MRILHGLARFAERICGDRVSRSRRSANAFSTLLTTSCALMLSLSANATVCDRYNRWLCSASLCDVMVLTSVEPSSSEKGKWDAVVELRALGDDGGIALDQEWLALRGEQPLEAQMLIELANALDVLPSDVHLHIVAVSRSSQSCWRLDYQFGHWDCLYRDITIGCAPNSKARHDHDCTTGYVPEGIARGGTSTSDFVDIERYTEMSRFEDYLRRRYARGEFKVLRRTAGSLVAQVSNLKNEILTDRSRWERLRISLAKVTEGSKTQLLVSVDATYAPGEGNVPPALSNYRDLEIEYGTMLTIYSAELATMLQQIGTSR